MQKFSLIHPRCGTAFLLWVMVIGIFVFAFVGQPAWYWLILSRILLLPVIAGIAYELIRFAGKHQDNAILMTLLAPGLWLQRLTTREPSLDQIEVSIRALQEVLRREGGITPEGAQGRGHGLGAADRPRGERGRGSLGRRRRGAPARSLPRRLPRAIGGRGWQDDPEELLAAATCCLVEQGAALGDRGGGVERRTCAA